MHPMLDVRIFTNLRFSAGSLSVTFAFFALFGFVFMVTQYFQFVRGYSHARGRRAHACRSRSFTGIAVAVGAPSSPQRFGTKAVVAAGPDVDGHRLVHRQHRRRPPRATPSSSCRWSSWAAASGSSPPRPPSRSWAALPPEQGRRRLGRERHDPRARRHARRGHRRQPVRRRSTAGGWSTASPVPGAPRGAGARQGLGRGGKGCARQGRRVSRRDPRRALRQQAVNTAFIDGFHAGSWVSAGVVLPAPCSPGASSPPGRRHRQPRRQARLSWSPVASDDMSTSSSASVAETAAALTARLPPRRGSGHVGVPGDGAEATAAARRRSRRRQDRGRQGAQPLDRRRAASGCSATRASTRRRPCTTGTTRASCSTCAPPRPAARRGRGHRRARRAAVRRAVPAQAGAAAGHRPPSTSRHRCC